METKFVVGEPVLYHNRDRFELGIVKSICPCNDNEEQDYFVNYHTGDTAARTPEHTLHKISNAYAFDIIRKSCEDFEPVNFLCHKDGF